MAREKKSGPTGPQGKLPQARLRKVYKEKVVPALMEQFKYTSVMQVPRLTKVVVNMGTGSEEKDVDKSMTDMLLITGQKPVSTSARKSVSNFKIREGMKVGCRVTLRGERAYHFLDKLATVALPRIRDFQGLSPKSFDGRGNFSLG